MNATEDSLFYATEMYAFTINIYYIHRGMHYYYYYYQASQEPEVKFQDQIF